MSLSARVLAFAIVETVTDYCTDKFDITVGLAVGDKFITK